MLAAAGLLLLVLARRVDEVLDLFLHRASPVSRNSTHPAKAKQKKEKENEAAHLSQGRRRRRDQEPVAPLIGGARQLLLLFRCAPWETKGSASTWCVYGRAMASGPQWKRICDWITAREMPKPGTKYELSGRAEAELVLAMAAAASGLTGKPGKDGQEISAASGGGMRNYAHTRLTKKRYTRFQRAARAR